MEVFHITKIVKVGTSLGAIIPRNVLAAMNWQRGDALFICPAAGDMIALRRLSDKEIREFKNTSIKL